ncbi:MAG: 3'(2'),5'-bisphosphate nucleotidase CysQ [Bacteroidota bacterium]
MEISKTYQIALNAIIGASEIIMTFYEQGFDTEIKSDGSPVTEADLASSNYLKQELANTEIPVVDEESLQVSYDIRKNWKQNWCVDPLDGTKEFIKKNGEFAVNIALIENHKAIFGLIASPVNREILVGGLDFGVFILKFEDVSDFSKWKKIELPAEKKENYSIIASRSHNSGLTMNFMEEIKTEFGVFDIISKGSALKFFELAKDEASIYPRFAPTMEWDIAAGQAILEELGGKVFQAKTLESLIYNKENLLNPSFVALTKFYANEFSENFSLKFQK